LKILIITSCTGEKTSSPANQLTLEDFARGGAHLAKREKELKDLAQPAGEIYTGQQHVRLMRGIEAAKADKTLTVDLHILSAGYGMIPGAQSVVPYECTFATMKTKELRQWADKLKVPQGFRETVDQKCDFGLVLLGDNYLDACALDAQTKFGGPTLLFCGTGTAKSLPPMKHVRVVAISNPEAKRFSCGLVALKGELAARVLKGVAKDPAVVKHLMDYSFDVLSWLEEQGAHAEAQGAQRKEKRKKPSAGSAAQREKTAPRARGTVNPKVDHVIQIPQSWWDKPHRKKLRYFIPEWDDLVDPDYDFITDQHAGDNCGWGNAVYAHQMYPEPNYDGLLMSRAVAEKSKAKKERINAMGVHRMLRVPREFPIMGDCGAFDYIMEETPPYTTEDVLDYYTRLDFDLGISVDHLIVSATEAQKQFRYDLTINNAEDFLKQHRKAGLKWEPIGAVQGWDPASYARAAEKYVKMGYKYIALGGLVRTTSREILEVVQKVREKVPANVAIHVLGVARLDWMNTFAEAGVQSADSASFLRQAWMRINQSYTSFDGPYAALRIPEAGNSFRAKHMEKHPDLSEEKILKMEQRALSAVRAYGAKTGSMADALESLLEYDQFVTSDRVDMRDAYSRTLSDRPWDKCGCAICQKWGIEVIIFRGNNRNRRRGFHNTYVFYRLLQQVLAGQPIAFLAKEGLKDQLQLSLT
jgi:hypothetical protein